MLKSAPVVLDSVQCRFVEQIIPDISQRGGWEFHNAACQPDHIHVLLSTDRDGTAVRKWLKRWLGEALSARYGSRSWWAEGGSVKHVWTDKYLRTVYEYVDAQRATGETP
jgi:REP element-mobilizing transposase RayT